MSGVRTRPARRPAFAKGPPLSSGAAIAHLISQSRSTGALNLSSRSLTEVPPAVYQQGDGVGSEIGWWEVAELTKLDVSRNELLSIPAAIFDFTSLTSLDVSANKLACLPDGLEKLALVRNLALSSNPLGSLPTAVTTLTTLASLSCSCCDLQQLPEGLGNSQQHVFAVLQASQNKLTSLPASLASATALLKLQLAENALTSLPEELVAGWVGLQELDLQFNKLKVLPEALGSLPKLQLLNVSQNLLTHLPASLCRASALLELHAGFNQLKGLPCELGMLAQLRLLNVCNNQITEVPAAVCALSLNLFDLRNNTLRSLPAQLGTMTTLRSLPLDGNPLKLIRRELWAGPISALLEFLSSRISDANVPHLSRTSSAVAAAQSTTISRSTSNISYHANTGGSTGGGNGAFGRDDSSGAGSKSASLQGKAGSISRQLGSSTSSELPETGSIPGFAGLGISNGHNRLGRQHSQQQRRTADDWAPEGIVAAAGAADDVPSSKGGAGGAAPSVQGHLHGHELVLKGRGLTHLPQDILEAAGSTTRLDLSDNPLGQIPPGFLPAFSSIRSLHLRNLGLTSWPLPLDLPGSLKGCTFLDISANPCLQLPPSSLVACPQLRSLDLSGVPAAAHLPDGFFAATPQLETLMLVNVPVGQQITDLLQQLPTGLKLLNLTAAQLGTLPPEVTRLSQLQHLDLTNNSLGSLPPLMGNMLPHLQVLLLEGNCFRTIRRQVLEKGTQGVLEYLKDRIPV